MVAVVDDVVIAADCLQQALDGWMVELCGGRCRLWLGTCVMHVLLAGIGFYTSLPSPPVNLEGETMQRAQGSAVAR